MMRKYLAYCWVSFFLVNCLGGTPDSRQFRPDDLDQLVEIYVRSNSFDDFKVFDEYQLKGKDGLRYTEAITSLSRDPLRWEKFLKKAQAYRQKIESRYAQQSHPAASAVDSGS